MEFIFKTETTMKPYNRKNWWIDGDIIRQVRIGAPCLEKALEKYAEIVNEHFGVSVSKNALLNKLPMYVNTVDGEEKQVGYVITGQTEFRNDEKYCWTKQYVDLWVEVLTIIETEFPAA